MNLRVLRTRTPPKKRLRPRPEVRVTRKVIFSDIKTEAAALENEQPWRTHGHNSKTLVCRDDAKIVLMAMKKDIHLHPHKCAGSVAMQAEKGRVRVHVPGDVVELVPGMILSVAPEVAHDIEAKEDSLLLLTFSPA